MVGRRNERDGIGYFEEEGLCNERDLIDTVGKPGVSGDAIQMLRTVNALFDACGPFIVFERDLSAADPPMKLIFLKGTLGGMTAWLADVFERLVEDWRRAVEGIRKGSHDFKIKVILNAPPQFEQALAEIEKIRKNPTKYM